MPTRFPSQVRHCLCLILLALYVGTPFVMGATETVLRGTKAHPFVLVLHAYGASRWSEGINRGITAELVDKAKVDLYVDYMDTKKIETPEYFELLHRLLALKYKRISFDLVVACDDNAYQFALKQASCRTLAGCSRCFLRRE